MPLRGKFLLVLFVLIASGCAGSESQNKSAASVAAGAAATPGSAQRIFIDPLTGEQRAPTAVELQQLRAASPVVQAKSAEPPRVVEYANGTVGVFIRKPKNQVQVEEAKDGSLQTYCKEGTDKGKDQP